MHPQQIRLVRRTFTPSLPQEEDSITLHCRVRRQRSRMVGDVIVRVWKASAACIGRVLHAFTEPETKRNPRTDVI